MSHKETLKLRKRYIEKRNFYASKEPIYVNEDDIEHLLTSTNIESEKNKFIIDYSYHSYNDIKPLCINLLKLQQSIKCFKQVMVMIFMSLKAKLEYVLKKV